MMTIVVDVAVSYVVPRYHIVIVTCRDVPAALQLMFCIA